MIWQLLPVFKDRGALNANVDKEYIKIKENIQQIVYQHSIVKEVLEDTLGFLIWQEQLSALVSKLGKNISIEDGHKLRKILTKRGTIEEEKIKLNFYNKFYDGCLEKGLKEQDIQEIWKKIEFFSKYSFNKSHSIGYMIISFQCAFLFTYFEPEWLASFLDKSEDKDKENIINIIKSFGYSIKEVDINISSNMWEISQNKKSFIQPLTFIKGLGEIAFKEILENRPFEKIEDLLFNKNIKYNKLNKKTLDVLCRSRSYFFLDG